MLSRYSVSQSSSLAGLMRESSALISGVPRNSQPASINAEKIGLGSPYPLSISSVSVAPQTPVRRIFALTASFCALRSEEHTSELQSLMRISYAVFCLKKKTQNHV